MERKSTKVKEAESWVDAYIEFNGHPPTYDILAEGLGLGKTATYARCEKFRNKMKSADTTKLRANNSTKIILQFVVPNEKYSEVMAIAAKINEFLIKTEAT